MEFDFAGSFLTKFVKKVRIENFPKLTIMIIRFFLYNSYKHYAQVFEQAKHIENPYDSIIRHFSPPLGKEFLLKAKAVISLHNIIISADYQGTFSPKKQDALKHPAQSVKKL